MSHYIPESEIEQKALKILIEELSWGYKVKMFM